MALAWDARVSRPTHARAAGERLDDRRRRPLANGTWVNEERVTARRRLRDGDIVRVGATAMAFCAPGRSARRRDADRRGRAGGRRPDLGPAPRPRRALPALPRRGVRHAGLQSRDRARALVSVDAVKSTMRALFDLFGIGDVPQNQKRAALALQALRGGVVSRRDL